MEFNDFSGVNFSCSILYNTLGILIYGRFRDVQFKAPDDDFVIDFPLHIETCVSKFFTFNLSLIVSLTLYNLITKINE